MSLKICNTTFLGGIPLLLLSVLLSTPNKKRLKPPLTWLETLLYAEGGTRTPMPIKAQRPERCVSTNFTTSACLSIMDRHYITVSHATCQEFFSTVAGSMKAARNRVKG